MGEAGGRGGAARETADLANDEGDGGALPRVVACPTGALGDAGGRGGAVRETADRAKDEGEGGAFVVVCMVGGGAFLVGGQLQQQTQQ